MGYEKKDELRQGKEGSTKGIQVIRPTNFFSGLETETCGLLYNDHPLCVTA
jgi:hypothetical protein